MLNNFCSHVYQKSLIICENVNGFFDIRCGPRNSYNPMGLYEPQICEIFMAFNSQANKIGSFSQFLHPTPLIAKPPQLIFFIYFFSQGADLFPPCR